MDLRRLEVFSKLMETRSFSKTAKELRLTQPTVSGHIKSLEQQIGLQLFDRHKRQVRPTGAAVVLLDYARRILELRHEAGYALEKFRGKISGELKIGGSTIPGTYILPAAIGSFNRVYEETRLTLVLGDTRGIVESVARSDLEMGLVGDNEEREGVAFEPLLDDLMVLAVSPGHPWANLKKPIPVEKLVETPFIIREEGSGTRSTMLDMLADRGLSFHNLNIVAEMGSTESVRQAIKAGLGASIISLLAVSDDVNVDLIKIVKVKGLNLRRSFYIATNQGQTRSPVCNAFMEFLRAEKNGLPQTG